MSKSETKNKKKKESLSIVDLALATVFVTAFVQLKAKRDQIELLRELRLKEQKKIEKKKEFEKNLIELLLGVFLVAIYFYSLFKNEASLFPTYFIGMIGGYFIGTSIYKIKYPINL